MEQYYICAWNSMDAADDDDSSSSEDSSEADGSYDSNGEWHSHKKKNMKKNTRKFLIQAYARDDNGHSVAINIEGYQPFFYVLVPSHWGAREAELFSQGLKAEMKGSLAYYRDTLVECKAISAKPLYGFTAFDGFRYVRLTFSSYSGFCKYRDLLTGKICILSLGPNAVQYEQYESNLHPLLRFLHINNLKPAGWAQIDKQYVRNHRHNRTTCNREVTVPHKYLLTCDREDIPKINTVSFDIESHSSHGDFPLAKKDYNKLARDIVTEFIRIKDEGTYSNMRPLVASFLKYAFCPYYNNNNIVSVDVTNVVYQESNEILTSPGAYAEITEYCSEPVYKILKESTIVELHTHLETMSDAVEELVTAKTSGATGTTKATNITPERLEAARQATAVYEKTQTRLALAIMDIFEEHFPTIDTTSSDYLTVARQVVMEYVRLTANNNLALRESPLKVIQTMLDLVLDPYYKNLNINVVYLKGKRPIPREKLVALVPAIHAICSGAYDIMSDERRARRHRKNGVKAKVKDLRRTVGKIDDKVTELTDVLNQYLPSVADDPVIQIGSVFKRYGETDPYLKHIICLKKTDNIDNKTLVDFEYDGVVLPNKEVINALKTMPEDIKGSVTDPGDAAQLKAAGIKISNYRRAAQQESDKAQVVVESYETEEEVLLAWQRIIAKEDPDLVIGYNTFAFDFKYLYERAQQLGIEEEFSKLGRIKDQPQKLIEQKLESAGMGQNKMYYIDMNGRVLIDMYKHMQRNAKMNSYKLDSVCKKYLFKQKVDITPNQIFTKQEGTSADRREVAEYCLIDCILTLRLMEKLEILVNNIGMAQVCSVPISYLFLRGQGVKLFSFLAKICRKHGYLIKVLPEEENEGKYEGAIVLPPDKNIHERVTAVADFNSLYPSCIISENLSHNSFVASKVIPKGESTDVRGQLLSDSPYEAKLVAGEYPGWDYNDIAYDVYHQVPVAAGRKKLKKIVVGHKVCRFATPPDGKKDIVPQVLIDLLESRDKSKKMRDTFPEGTFRWNIYEALQLAYKVTANSLYGIMGASTSQIRFRDIAACTTATGRKLINFSANFVLKNYPGSKITYGDTDSIFVQFPTKNRKGEELKGLDAVNKSILQCREAAMCISKQLKSPHNLEFEKAIFPFILLSKKRYHGNYYKKYGNPSCEANSMGIVLKRRDNADIVKHVFGGMIKIIMEDHSVDKAIEFVKTECTKVLRGEFPMNMFLIAKTLRSYYKNPDSIAHNVLAQRIGKRDPGNKPGPNDRIAYVFIMNPEAENQGERIETPEYVVANDCKLDYGYYLTNQIWKPVMQILDLAGKGQGMFERLLQDYHSELDGLKKIEKYDCISVWSDSDRRAIWRAHAYDNDNDSEENSSDGGDDEIAAELEEEDEYLDAGELVMNDYDEVMDDDDDDEDDD